MDDVVRESSLARLSHFSFMVFDRLFLMFCFGAYELDCCYWCKQDASRVQARFSLKNTGGQSVCVSMFFNQLIYTFQSSNVFKCHPTQAADATSDAYRTVYCFFFCFAFTLWHCPWYLLVSLNRQIGTTHRPVCVVSQLPWSHTCYRQLVVRCFRLYYKS